MKAMVLHKISPVESSPLVYQDLPDPVPEPGQVRVRIKTCGVCRTDLHVIEGELPQQRLPIVPGHQIVGEVDMLGAGIKRLQLGQRIGVAWLRHACGRCDFCRQGRENLCEQQRFTGYHEDGGFAELATVDEDYAYEIPAAFDDVQAAPLLCAGIVGYRALKRANLPEGGKLAIYGFGSSAHVIMQIAMFRRCEAYVVTRGEEHRQLARQMGARWVGARAADMPVQADSAIIFAPAGDLVPAALEKLAKGGTCVIAGIYMSAIPALDYGKHLFFERDLRGVTANTRADGVELLHEAAKIPIRPHTVTYTLSQANQALQDLKADRIRGTAVLVVPLITQ
jgi:propanol-preferring alcohol dehydrogenase